MSTSEHVFVRLSVTALVLVAVVISAAFAIRPATPREWRKIRTGMTREAALAVLRDPVIDMRDLKGFDVASRETTMLGGSSYWQLLITYDASGQVNTAKAHFIHSGCGISNPRAKSVL
jgi:hypothetical protein